MVDNREVIKPSDFEGNQFPFLYSAVAAVDSFFVGEKQEGGIARFFFTSSGVIIDPKHALTTAHSVYTDRKGRLEEGVTATAIRVTNSEEQEKLVSRKVGTSSNDPSRNVDAKDVSFLKNYNKLSILEKDIALLSTVSLAPGDNLLPPEEVFGLIAFVNPADADDNDNESDRNQRRFLVETAGYPGNNAKIPGSTTTPGNEDARRARDLVRSPQNGKETGNIFNLTQRGSFVTSSEISATSGQSGSGIWSTLDGDDPRVLGIITTDSVGLANSRNYGVLITTDVYNSIINQIEVDSGTSNADLLPENAIIGSDPSFLGLVGGNDYIAGTYRKERIIGSGGDDRLYGDGADDRLEGGDGTDQALFSEVFTNYTYTLPTLVNPRFEFNHVRGSRRDAKDTTKDIEFAVFEFLDSNGDEKDDDGNLFFVPLQTDTDRNGNIKLKDGSIITPREQVLDEDGDNIATMTVESPDWMLDGDVEYDLTIGLDITQSYNLAFIIDNSESTGDGTLSQTKNAVKRLIDAFEQSGLDSNTDYGIVNFNTTATLVPTEDSTKAKNAVDTITSIPGGKTNYSAGLSQGIVFFNPSYIADTLDPIIPDSVFDTPDQRNIAYFISDGQPTLINGTPDVLNLYIPTANRLKLYADEVRAFGTNGATLNKLRIIDSDADPQLLANAGELFDAFDTSIDVNTIESVEVKKVGTDGISELVETIPASKLNKEGLNLTYEGSIDELDVSREAENEITFELIFKDSANIDDVSLDYTITTGQSEIRRLTNNGTREISSFTNNQLDFEDDEIALGALNATGNTVTDRDLVGNDLDNTIKVRRGTNSIFGNGGDDRFSLLGGVNFVNGGEGVDTVILDRTLAEAGEISQSGNLTYIGTNVSLVDVEFVQFRDTRLAADTLAIAPTISLEENAISVVEGNTGSSLATFVVNLSNPSTEDVAVDVSFESGFAEAIDDFVLPTQPLVIPAGETTGEITLEVVGDELAEGDEEILLDLAVAENATFANGATSETVGVNIADDDSEIFVSLIEEESGISEGDLDRPSVFSLTLNRFGGLANSDVVAVEIVPTEDNSIVAADFVGGISPTGSLVAGLTPIIGDIFGVLPPKLVTFAQTRRFKNRKVCG